MVHRDDREAARQRIEALERDLADARADVASAKAEAERARRELSRAPAKAPRKSDAKGERPAKKKRRASAARPAPTDAELLWAPPARQHFSIAIGVLAGLAYGGAALVFGQSSEEAMNVAFAAGGAAVGAMVVGAFVLARIYGAPEAFGAALVTLLISAMVLGGIGFAWIDGLWSELLSPGSLLTAMQIVASLVAVGSGVAASVNWVTDAASSPIQPDP